MAMRRRWRWLLVAVGLLALLAVYVPTHPLVIIEPHAHCIMFSGRGLDRYASVHQGRYRFHPQRYGNALLLLDDEYYHALTGPGYDPAPLREAKRLGRDLPEVECGRVYVQGLTKQSNQEIALLFDKLPTPG